MEVIIFAVFAFVLVWKFSGTEIADDPVEVHNPNHAAPGATSALIAAVTLLMSLMALGALVGGGQADVGVYATARQAGDDAVTLVAMFAAVGGLAVLAMVNGIAFKLSFAVLLFCVVGSVVFISALGG
jgi:hypothetical protein